MESWLPQELDSVTTTALLESLFREEDPQVWSAFEARLRPVLLRVAMRMGLSLADAQDAGQECLAQVVAAGREGGYQRSKGRLRSWILGVLKHRVSDVHRQQQNLPSPTTESVMANVASDSQLSGAWEQESRRQLVIDAFEALRGSGEFSAENLEAFKLFGVDGRPAAQVAAQLGMTRWAVYKAAQRCRHRFGQIVAELTATYEF